MQTHEWKRSQEALVRALTVMSAPLPDTMETVTVTVPLDPPVLPAPAGGLPGAGPALESLHPREREVLAQLVLGRRNRDIAAALHISPSTVKFHVANILGKLGAGSRGEAVAMAHSAGLAPGTVAAMAAATTGGREAARADGITAATRTAAGPATGTGPRAGTGAGPATGAAPPPAADHRVPTARTAGG